VKEETKNAPKQAAPKTEPLLKFKAVYNGGVLVLADGSSVLAGQEFEGTRDELAQLAHSFDVEVPKADEVFGQGPDKESEDS